MFVNFTLTLTHNFVDHHHRCPLSGDLLSRSNVFSLAEPSLTNDSDSLLTLIIIKVVNNYPKRGHRTAVPEPPEGCRLQCGAMRFGLIGATVFFFSILPRANCDSAAAGAEINERNEAQRRRLYYPNDLASE